jgi:4-hydroxy-2-oxoheptanedioate aldolase
MTGAQASSPSLAAARRGGQPLSGLLVKMPAPALVELCGHVGLDFVVIDLEHGLGDASQLEHHLRAADAVRIPALVRVASVSGAELLRALDAGAQGIVVPHVNTVAEAEVAVKAAHYPPRGTRSLALTTRAGAQGTVALAQHLEAARRETFVMVQIEDSEAVANAEKIAATPGVDAALIGPTDLALSLGVPGQADHPDLVAAITRAASAVIGSRNACLCVLAGTAQEAGAWRDRGAQIVLFNGALLIAEAVHRVASAARPDATVARLPRVERQ